MEWNRIVNFEKINLEVIVDNKYVKFISRVDREINRNLCCAGVQTRPTKSNSNGIWCGVLIPAILLNYCIIYKVNVVYHTVAYLSLGMLLYSLLFSLFLYLSKEVLTSYRAGSTVSIFVSTIPIYCYLELGITFSFCISSATIILYAYILHVAITKCPKTFTVGEALIVSQGFTLFVMTAVTSAYIQVAHPKLSTLDEETLLVYDVILTALSAVGLIVAVLILFVEDMRERTLSVIYLMSSAIAYSVILLYVLHGPIFLPKLINYIFGELSRVTMFMTWAFLLVIAIVVLHFRTEMGDKASTVTRKSFHILGSLVFLTGILYDVKFISLAAGIGLALIILAEAFRISRLEPVSSRLQAAFNVYSDEKDCGKFAMTPIYLYCGLACPLALVPERGGARASLDLLSGILSIGIGDAAASWFGERYGKTKWPNSTRSLEGTTCNIMSQIFTVYVLEMLQLLDARMWFLRASISAVVSGLVESQTDQIDNLVLPLVSILAFQSTYFVAF